MPRYDEQGFKSKKRIENEKRDRSVPVDENYYSIPPVDLNFNSKENDDNDTDKFNSFGYADDYINSIREHEKAFDVDESNEKDYSNIMDYNSYDDEKRKDRNKHKKSKKRNSNKSSNKNKGLKIAVPIVAVLLVLVLIPVFLLSGIMNKINYTDSEPMKIEGLYSESGIRNVLLLGVDALSEGDHGTSRSDSMMLITLDSKHHCIKMTSFLRDSWVYIPKIDKHQRLNASCSYGGYQGVVDTIEYNFGIKIDGYVVANFEMFETLVDSIGGVEVEVTEKEAKEINSHQDRYGYVTIEAGKHNLTGKQALAYCRIRKIDTDFVRTQRQRTVITAIINKMKSSGLPTLYKMASNAVPYVETTLSKTKIMSLGMLALQCIIGEMVQGSVPYDNTWEYKNINGNSVISLDVDKNKEMLKENLYKKTAEEFKESNK